MKKVVWNIYSPDGDHILTCFSRQESKKQIDDLNKDINAWDYHELYKYMAVVINV